MKTKGKTQFGHERKKAKMVKPYKCFLSQGLVKRNLTEYAYTATTCLVVDVTNQACFVMSRSKRALYATDMQM